MSEGVIFLMLMALAALALGCVWLAYYWGMLAGQEGLDAAVQDARNQGFAQGRKTEREEYQRGEDL